MPKNKLRLDIVLTQLGLAPSREKAQALILAGKVKVNDRIALKAGEAVTLDAEIMVIEPDHPFVSRGGVKLRHALNHFALDVSGRTIIDVGASTGGFTDCLLQAGAALVHAVDVGYGQLDDKLRRNPKVRIWERINIRHLDAQALAPRPEQAVIDVSFISLEKVLPPVKKILAERGEIIALIKPQFEVGKGQVGKGGVVRNDGQHQEVIEKISSFSIELGYEVIGTIASPIKGPKGNREFFIYLKANAD